MCLARRIEMEKYSVLVGCGGGLQEQILSDLFELKHSDNKNVLTLVMTSRWLYYPNCSAR